ncbi:hypothetical protein VTK56DRAFT_3106 [Thermocarpiscus australiensis]
MQNLAATLHTSFSRGWPSWRSIRGQPESDDVEFTIRLADKLKEEATALNLSERPEIIIRTVRDESRNTDRDRWDEMWEQLEQSLIRVVYGSNMIELAGSSYNITVRLCMAVFRGMPVNADIEERDDDYREHLEHLLRSNGQASHDNVLRSRREIIQHAQALNYVIGHIVLNDKHWTEEVILEAHRILHSGLDDEVESGVYRSYPVAVRYGEAKQGRKAKPCIRASAMPRYMKEMVKQLNQNIADAEESQVLDPYTLAARYHHQFVSIHPFGDGNGRISRIIMNVLLLKYAGHVSEIGLEPEEREQYRATTERGANKFYGGHGDGVARTDRPL